VKFLFSVLILNLAIWNVSADPAPTLTPNPSRSPASGLEEELLNLRDPFRVPDLIFKKEIARTELESYPVESFKLVGVLTGPDRMRAMILTPNAKTFFVSERTKIGVRGGIIRKIDTDSIRVREKIVNTLGQEENIDTEIRLAPENAPQVESTDSGNGVPSSESPTRNP
jgi:Tfp pilus assembly protein PilP